MGKLSKNIFDKSNEDIVNSIDDLMDYEQGKRVIELLEHIMTTLKVISIKIDKKEVNENVSNKP